MIRHWLRMARDYLTDPKVERERLGILPDLLQEWEVDGPAPGALVTDELNLPTGEDER